MCRFTSGGDMPVGRKYSSRSRGGNGSNPYTRKVTGGGKYSFGRSLRKGVHSLQQLGRGVRSASKALGVESVRKAAADRARSMAIQAITGRGAYMNRGLVGGRGMYVDNASSRLRKGQYHGPNYSSFKGANADDGAVTVSNQEFFQYLYAPKAVNGTIPYESFSTDVQPGTMCPLLAQMACNFERYEMKQCMFHFETSLDGAALQSSTGQVGDIMMVSHMDVNSPDYTNSSEFEHNSSHVVSTRVTSGLTCGVECDPKQMHGLLNGGINLIRSSELLTGEDKAKFDQARVQIALNNLNPALEGRCLGRVYISYTVKLIKQRLYSSIGRTIRADEYTYRASSPWIDQKTGFDGTKKAPLESFKCFVTEDPKDNATPYVMPMKESWSSLGTEIEAIKVPRNFSAASLTPLPLSDAEAFKINLDGNTSGLFRIQLKAWTQITDATVATGIPDWAFPEFQIPLVAKITSFGNVDLVSFRDRISSDLTSTLNETDPLTPANDKVDLMANVFMASQLAQSGNTNADGTILGTFEMYFRVAPATSNVTNAIQFQLNSVSGTNNAAVADGTNENRIMQSSIRIEQVNDHERLSPKKISTIDELHPV